MLDPRTGRYSFFEGDTVTTVDQRPIEAMLRSGAIEKDAVGQCYIKPGLDLSAGMQVRKTHLSGTDGERTICRYTKHPRARARWLSASEFARLPANEKCPDCESGLHLLA